MLFVCRPDPLIGSSTCDALVCHEGAVYVLPGSVLKKHGIEPWQVAVSSFLDRVSTSCVKGLFA